MLKSTLPLSNKILASGEAEENYVAWYLESLGWEFCFHRFKTKVAEIDLIFIKKNQVLLLEVKTLSDPLRVFDRLSAKQKEKYQKNIFLFRSLKSEFEFLVYVAFVNRNRKIHFCEIN